MTKTILYITLLVILAAGVYFFVFKQNDSLFSTKEANFTIQDTAEIGKIFLAQNNGESVTIERTAKGWMLNGKYPALASTTKMLLSTLAEQTATAPIPEKAHNNVIRGMAGTNIKVEVYDKRGKQMRVFYVGGEAQHNSTYMLMDGASTAYFVSIQGFSGYLTPRYPTDWRDWRDRTVFSIPPEEFKSFSVTYKNEPLNSFSMNMEKEHATVTGDPAITNNKPLNTHRVNSFIKFMQNVYCEGYINNLPGTREVINDSNKKCTIDVAGKNSSQHIEVYWMLKDKRSKNLLTPMANHPNEYDADRYFALINNNKDTIIIQRGTFEKIFRSCYEFFTPDEEQ